MIKSISLNSPDSYDKQRHQAMDDARSSDFASLFSMPVPQQIKTAPVKQDQAETSSSHGSTAQKDESGHGPSKGLDKPELASPQKMQGLRVQGLTKPSTKTNQSAPSETTSDQAPPALAGDTSADRSIVNAGVKGGFGLAVLSSKRAMNEILPGRGKYLSPPLAGPVTPVPGKDETVPVRPLPGCYVTDVKPPVTFDIQMPSHRRHIVEGGQVSDGVDSLAEDAVDSKFGTPRLNVDIKTDLSMSTQVKPGTAPRDADPIGNPVAAKPDAPKAEPAVAISRDSGVTETAKTVRPDAGGHSSSQSDAGSPETGNAGKTPEMASTQILENFAGLVSKTQTLAAGADERANLRQALLDQIEPNIRQIALRTADGLKHQVLKMRLNPADLGALEITLDRGAGGKINAHIQTDSESTRRILGETLNQLRASLESSGSQVGELKISYDSSAQNGGKRQQDQTQNFGPAEGQTAAANNRDGISQSEDADQDRLVNLRA